MINVRLSLCSLVLSLVIVTHVRVFALPAQVQTDSEQLSQVIRTIPLSHDDLMFLDKLTFNFLYDFWLLPREIGMPVDIMAQGRVLDHLKQRLQMNGIFYFVLMSNVEAEVKNHLKQNEIARNATKLQSSGECLFSWEMYHTYEEIEIWLKCLAATYPLKVTLVKVGRSYEYRPMYLLKLSKMSSSIDDKPAIWVDGGIHGREWISPAVVTYMLSELLTNPHNDHILDQVDFFFMPVMNPDGYVYTFTEEGRLWKKSRSRQESVRNCVGVDPNRNWSFNWNEGFVDFPCSDTYPGEAPFSEKEMQLIRNEIIVHFRHIKAYLTYHAYSQLWLFPWGYTTEMAPNYEELEAMSTKAVNAIYSYDQTRYRQQPMCIQEGLCTYGSSIDWMKGIPKIKYPFQVHLPDLGNYGYLLPPSYIESTGEESLRGLKVIAEELSIRGKERIKRDP